MSERVKFYMDEHVANAVVRGLRRQGVDVLTAFETTMQGASDEVHLALATREGRVLFTQDADLIRLHATGVAHTGIAYVPQHTPLGPIIRGLLLIYEVLDADSMKGKVEFL